jgi:hypothetical protein
MSRVPNAVFAIIALAACGGDVVAPSPAALRLVLGPLPRRLGRRMCHLR